MTSIIQRSFAGGYLSPQLFGRVDTNKYATGLRTCRNVNIQRFGGLENRSGTAYIDSSIDASSNDKAIKFVITPTDAYLLWFTAQNIIPYYNGQKIDISGSPAWLIGTPYTIGDVVSYFGVFYYAIANSTGLQPPTFPLSWKPLPSTYLIIPSGLTSAAVSTFQSVQINDIMILADQTILPKKITRFSHTKWAIQPFPFGSVAVIPTGIGLTIGVPPAATIAPPAGIFATGGLGGTKPAYFVTSFQNSPAAESPKSAQIVASIGAASAINPVVLTWSAVAGAKGYVIYRQTNPSLATNPGYIIGIVNALTFSDDGSFPVVDPGIAIRKDPGLSGNSTLFDYVVTSINGTTSTESLQSAAATGVGGTPTAANPNIISWSAVTGASKYRIYRNVSGVYQFIGESVTTSFNDINIAPDASIQPPANVNLFGDGFYPAVVGSYQQRLWFANTITQPQTAWGSKIGSITDFNVSTPTTDSDSVTFTIAGRQVQKIRSIVDLGSMIIHTSGGEYVAKGNQFGTVTPTQINLVQQGYAGSESLVPVVIGNTDLFIQARGNILRDLRYEIQSTSYTGKDTTIFAPDLFMGRTVVDMDWQQIYNSIVYCVLSDGTMNGLTYIREHDIWGWHYHDTTNGLFKNVCVVPEGTQDAIYVIVQRTINGGTVKYLERFANRDFTDITTDAFFVDCGLTYDGRNTNAALTMALTTGGGWTTVDNLTLTSSAGYFSAGNVGSDIVFQQRSSFASTDVSDSVSLRIIAYISPTIVTVQPSKNVPTWAQAPGINTWGKAVHSFSGASHIEGQAISALGDGVVALNALTDATPTVVTAGAFTTTSNYLVLHAGLPIQADLQGLDVENTQGETLVNKRKLITEVCVIFYKSRGGYYGQDENHLNEWKQRGLQNENWNDPVFLYTGPVRIPIQGSWQNTGQVFIRQNDPLPLGISAIVPSAYIGS